MDRVSVRQLGTAIRLIREPVVVTYSYPRSHPLYGAGEECGVFVPMKLWERFADDGLLPSATPPGIKLPDIEEPIEPMRIK